MSARIARRTIGATTFIAIAALTACSDSVVAPTATPRAARTSQSNNGSGNGSNNGSGSAITLVSSSTVNGVTTSIVVLNPVLDVSFHDASGNLVKIPAGAICDPATTAYGPAFWDAECDAANSPIRFAVTTWTDAQNRPRMEFLPDVRFSPSKTAAIYFKRGKGDGKIVWCPTGSLSCVDESLTDASLATVFDANGGFLYRRVKHFSGYMVTVGLTDEGSDSTQTGEGY